MLTGVPSSPPSIGQTFGQPICFSQKAVMAPRTPSESQSKKSRITGCNELVDCLHELATRRRNRTLRVRTSEFLGFTNVEQISGSCVIAARVRNSPQVAVRRLAFRKTFCACSRARLSAASSGTRARRACPFSNSRPANRQPIVPSRRATTLFGTPASIRDCAPIILRVRPAQLTTTSVSDVGTFSRMINRFFLPDN